jgi:hypothetical protein
MALTAKQERFIQEYEIFARSQKGQLPTIEGVCKGLVHLYITATDETSKEYTAWMIARIKPEIQLIGIEQVIDKAELLEYAMRKQGKINKLCKATQKRRHQKRDDFALTDKEWKETIEYFDYSCAYCGESEKLTYEHFIPFSKGGSFKKDNIIPVCKRCNSSKRDNDFILWYPKQSFFSKAREINISEYLKLA